VNRLTALQTVMAREEVDLVVVGPTANLRYLIDYPAPVDDRITVLLVTRDSAVMLIPDFGVPEFLDITGFQNVADWNDKFGPQPGVDAAFAKLGELPDAPVTAVDDELPYAFLAELQSRLGTRAARRLSELIGPLRIVKSDEELERIKRAGELVSVGVDVALERARPGISERLLRSEIETALWQGGAESMDFVVVQAGPESASPHHDAGPREIREGEPVLIDIAVRVDGYFADITQQVFLGTPTADYVQVYEAVFAAQEAGVRASLVGATIESIDRAASQALSDAGFALEGRTGHGLGLDVHEPPSVVTGNEEVVRSGMVFTVEPGIYLPGRFGVRIEDTVVATPRGPVRVTRGSRPLLCK
jgi:Xaa-Pro aminopeptidase